MDFEIKASNGKIFKLNKSIIDKKFQEILWNVEAEYFRRFSATKITYNEMCELINPKNVKIKFIIEAFGQKNKILKKIISFMFIYLYEKLCKQDTVDLNQVVENKTQNENLKNEFDELIVELMNSLPDICEENSTIVETVLKILIKRFYTINGGNFDDNIYEKYRIFKRSTIANLKETISIDQNEFQKFFESIYEKLPVEYKKTFFKNSNTNENISKLLDEIDQDLLNKKFEEVASKVKKIADTEPCNVNTSEVSNNARVFMLKNDVEKEKASIVLEFFQESQKSYIIKFLLVYLHDNQQQGFENVLKYIQDSFRDVISNRTFKPIDSIDNSYNMKTNKVVSFIFDTVSQEKQGNRIMEILESVKDSVAKTKISIDTNIDSVLMLPFQCIYARLPIKKRKKYETSYSIFDAIFNYSRPLFFTGLLAIISVTAVLSIYYL